MWVVHHRILTIALECSLVGCLVRLLDAQFLAKLNLGQILGCYRVGLDCHGLKRFFT